jgi:hypothetical protein
MYRRCLLLGAAGALAAVAGCNQRGSSERQPAESAAEGSVTPDTETTRTARENGIDEATPRRVTASIDSEPHTISLNGTGAGYMEPAYTLEVLNESTAARTISLSLLKEREPVDPVLRRTYTFESNTHLRIEIATAGTYHAEMRLGDGKSDRKTVTTTSFTVTDCSRSWTRIVVADGGVETTSQSTCRN